jgi:hypothetical protein
MLRAVLKDAGEWEAALEVSRDYMKHSHTELMSLRMFEGELGPGSLARWDTRRKRLLWDEARRKVAA